MDRDPHVAFSFYSLANVLAHAGRIDETASLRESVHALAPGRMFANIGNVYERAESGDVDGVRAALTPELKELSTWHLGVAGDLASACAIAGATEEALDLLERAIDLGWFSPEFWNRHDASFEYLRGNEQFERLMEKARERAAAFVE